MPSTPLPPVANTIRIRHTHQLGDDLTVDNIQYATYPSADAPLTEASVNECAVFDYGAWAARILPAMSNQVTYVGCTITDLDTATGFEVTHTGVTVGGVSQQPAPAGACMVVSLRTAVRGRSFRGRQYLSGLTPQSNMLDAQHWSTALTSAMFTDFANYISDISLAAAGPPTNPFPQVLSVVSFYSGVDATTKKPIRRATPIATKVTDLIVDTRVGSQRRRYA